MACSDPRLPPRTGRQTRSRQSELSSCPTERPTLHLIHPGGYRQRAENSYRASRATRGMRVCRAPVGSTRHRHSWLPTRTLDFALTWIYRQRVVGWS